ncbi:MAG: peptidoglycan DD-metalloendopeptidase family protein [Pseudomonadota bacterium]
MTQPDPTNGPPAFPTRLMIVVTLMVISGCVANPLRWDPDTHIVQTGETLAVIALRYELSVRDLAAWNRLTNPDKIWPGQRLRITRPDDWGRSAPATASTTVPTKPAPTRWFWPAEGQLVPNRNHAGVGDGINVSNRLGSPIFATADGKVVYSGTGLTGYGKLIIIKHNERFLSAYGYNHALLVKEGEQVKGGQRVATMGVGPNKMPMLHFEIRRDGKPVKPLDYLSPKP